MIIAISGAGVAALVVFGLALELVSDGEDQPTNLRKRGRVSRCLFNKWTALLPVLAIGLGVAAIIGPH